MLTILGEDGAMPPYIILPSLFDDLFILLTYYSNLFYYK